MSRVKAWKVIESSREQSYKVFNLRRDLAESPRTGEQYPFYVIESPSWVNVIPLTEDGEVILIRQYRHGIREVTLEIPGGMVEPGMTPLDAGRSELREETGYVADTWVPLGWVHPNPAIQENRCYSFLALDLTQKGGQKLDDLEDIQVLSRPITDIPALIREGAITHALMIDAFYRFFMEFEGRAAYGSLQTGS